MKRKTCLIAYDIANDNKRIKVAEILEYYALQRIQYSVFEGQLSKQEMGEIVDFLGNFELEPGDKVYIYPVCPRCFRNRLTVGERTKGTREHKII